VMYDTPQGRGYIQLRTQQTDVWLNQVNTVFSAHEFHYSRVENLAKDSRFAYKVLRGQGIDGEQDGLLYKNTLASYAHLRHVDATPWTRRFVDFVYRQNLKQTKD